MIDTTFHVSDLLVMGGALCGVIGFVGRKLIRAVNRRIAGFDHLLADHGTKLTDHTRRIGDVERTIGQHEAALNRLGFYREGPDHPYVLRHGQGEV